jgi:S-DNA-T family DNA segregation ATPase FtsK/SpoIIIE
MLFMEGGGRVVRVHGPFVDDGEVEAVANFLRQQGEPEYDDRVVEDPVEDIDAASAGEMSTGNSLYEQAVQLVVCEQKASTSFVQRHLKIGYNRAATIIEDMERNGIISAANHVGKRDVLISNDAGQGEL